MLLRAGVCRLLAYLAADVIKASYGGREQLLNVRRGGLGVVFVGGCSFRNHSCDSNNASCFWRQIRSLLCKSVVLSKQQTDFL